MFDQARSSRSQPRTGRLTTALLAGCSGAMLAFAVPEMLGSTGMLDLIKAGIVAGAATITSFAVTRMAVEQGAPQAACGMTGSTLVSVASVLAIGLGLFASTYAGFTLRETEELRLGDFGRELAVYADARGRSAFEAGRAAPVLRSIVDDLSLKAECERQASCLSGRERGGSGPVARLLDDKRQRAETILGQVNEGERVRTGAVAQLGALLQRYRAELIDPDASQTERRKVLQAIAGEIGTQLNLLDEAAPTTLLQTYALELQAPVAIPAQREISARLDSLLQAYANSLSASLRGFASSTIQRPVFPTRTGVAHTFLYIGYFIPIAAIVAVVELIFPLSLWLHTLFTLKANMVQQERPDELDEPDSLAMLQPTDEGVRGLSRRPRPVRPA